MERNQEKKTAFVSGASDGIGVAISGHFLKDNWNVIGTCRNLEKQTERKTENYNLYECNQNSLIKIKEFARENLNKISNLDACVLNAGVAKFGLLEDITEQDYDDVMNINLKGTIFLLQAILPKLAPHSSIILIGSISPKLGMKGSTIYSAGKAGLLAFTKVMANELSNRNIRVNIISPGVIDTNMYNKFQLSETKVSKMKAKMVEKTNFKRLGTSGEVADLVLFLASDKSKYITGQEFVIDGGLTSNYL